MANEFRKVTDQNGVDHPVCDDTRVDWSSYAKTGADNLMPSNIYELNTASAEVGESTFTTYTGVQSFIAPIKRNTTYTLSRTNGNRFRVALSTSFPANGIACNVLINANINEYTFNSGNYDYVFVMLNAGSETYDNIKPVLNVGSVARPFVPYAMTNQQLMEELYNLFAPSKQLTASNDMNSIANGVYYQDGGESYCPTNAPNDNGEQYNAIVWQFQQNIANRYVQIWYSINGHTIYYRDKALTNVWAPWRKLSGSVLS